MASYEVEHDAGSGVWPVWASQSAGSSSAVYVPNGEGEYGFRVRGTDRAGHEAQSAEQRVIVDRTLPRVTEALMKHGYDNMDIRKILGDNILRVVQAVLG